MRDALSALSWTKRLGVSFVCGALLTLTFAPFFYVPLLWLSFIPFLVMLSTAESKKRVFFLGWMFGFGHFVSSLYWIANSLLVDAAQFAWLIPFAVSLIPAILAIYIGLLCLVVERIQFNSPIANASVFAVLWVLAEWARTHFFSGFPWNLLGYNLLFSDHLVQLAYYVKVSGLSFMVAFVAALPAMYIVRAGSMTKRSIQKTIFVSLLIILGNASFGIWRISSDPLDTNVEKLSVRLVQANIEQLAQTSMEDRVRAIDEQLELSNQVPVDGGDIPDVIIWPESGINFFIDDDAGLREYIGSRLPRGSVLISGTLRSEVLEEKRHFYNSMVMLNDAGSVVAHYDKQHLVPFGEYVPLKGLLPFLDKIVEGASDYSAGQLNDTVIQVDGVAPFSPAICYEVIFPNAIVKKRDVNPRWIVNLTNDAWFGDTIGPQHHFQMSRMRAIEEGLPLVRVAITGMSGVIDAYGRVVDEPIPYGKKAVKDITLRLPSNP